MKNFKIKVEENLIIVSLTIICILAMIITGDNTLVNIIVGGLLVALQVETGSKSNE